MSAWKAVNLTTTKMAKPTWEIASTRPEARQTLVRRLAMRVLQQLGFQLCSFYLTTARCRLF